MVSRKIEGQLNTKREIIFPIFLHFEVSAIADFVVELHRGIREMKR